MSEIIIPREQLRELDPQDQHNLIRLTKKLRKNELNPRQVGEVLPEAVVLGEESQRKISKSMVEVTERAIENSIIRNPEKLSTALFPIIGTAIRKAVNQILANMMNNLNSGMEKAFSFKRLLWRIESMRTGVPFMEIVLKNTMLYRVEHLFLIHSDTGILLRSLSAGDSLTADEDVVASMLTAVRSYIKDSLSLEDSETVNVISTGEYSIFIESGPRALLASVVRGASDGLVRERMVESLENIHLKFSSALTGFSGETEEFEAADPLLKPCLLSQGKGGKGERRSPSTLLLFSP